MKRFFTGATTSRMGGISILPLLLACLASLGVFGHEAYHLPSIETGWAIGLNEGRLPAQAGTIEIRGTGELTFEPSEIMTLRPDLFQPGQFSVFDVLVHLAWPRRT